MSITNSYNHQLSNGYYQLSANNGAASATDTSSAKLASTNSASAANSAFLLSLSPEAQDYLNSVGLAGNVSANTSTSSFTLSPEQQAKLDGIIAKYKGEPFSQETFDKIQNDLHAAGLAPDQLAQQAQVKDFNPTAELISALNGKDTSSSTSTDASKADASKYDSQKNNYIQQISDAFEKVAAPAVAAA